jgi:hypothetical protein
MRLLNTSTISLEEFFDDQLPPYAILSHRWQADEVSFQHMQSGAAIGKAGYAKIGACCEQALRDGYEYAWVFLRLQLPFCSKTETFIET